MAFRHSAEFPLRRLFGWSLWQLSGAGAMPAPYLFGPRLDAPEPQRLACRTMNSNLPYLHRQPTHKFAWVTLFGLLVILPALLAGCATSRDSQQSAAPTVSGSVSVGVGKSF